MNCRRGSIRLGAIVASRAASKKTSGVSSPEVEKSPNARDQIRIYSTAVALAALPASLPINSAADTEQKTPRKIVV